MSVGFYIMSRLIVPLMGIWIMELNADYGLRREQGLRLDVTIENKKKGLVRRSLGTLTHPPEWLRIWFVKKNDWVRDFLRNIIFPASYLTVIILICLSGLFSKLSGAGAQVDTIVIWLWGLSLKSFGSLWWRLCGMAAFILLWPQLSGYWENLFVGQHESYKSWDMGRSLAALFMGSLAMVAWCLK